MRRLVVREAAERLPGAAPVSDHSVFSAVASAVPLAAQPVPRAASRRAELLRAPPRWSLRGEWRRLPLADDPPSIDALPPLGDAAYERVFVPNNFGLEPSLSTHFGPVYYRRKLPRFPPPELGRGRCALRLVFDAVDYLCDAWLDARHLGRHEGYFAPFAFDLSDIDDGAVLTVRVQDPFEDLDPQQPFVLHAKRVIKGVLKYHDSRPGGLPGRHTPGWTAREGQSMSTGGITGDVRLEATGSVRLDALFVTPLDLARVQIAVVLTGLAEPACEVELELVVLPPRGEPLCVVLRASVPRGAGRIDLETELPDAAPWWPASHRDLGEPALYELEAAVRVDESVSDVRRTRFGLRTARVEGEPKRLVVNGRPTFVQAVNYIPRQHFADVDLDFYRRDMRLVADAHLNSLGIHGHLQCPPCYEAADEAGMLVFQDFALQWHYDAGETSNPSFKETACKQIAEMAYLLQNHPSVVYFACHNEPTALFIPGMPRDPIHDRDNQVLDEALELRLRQVERVRHVHRASGIGDDVHLYDGSLLGGVVYDVRKHESWFVSEFGFWTPAPTSGRWGDLRWPPDADQTREWLARLSFGGATYAFAGLPERYPTLDAWRRATESYGAFLAKYQTEWIRIRRGQPFHAYRWHFFSDWWGWAGGGLVDVDRAPKATYRALRAASRPVLIATSLPDTVFAPGSRLVFPIHGINETRQRVMLEVAWRWLPEPCALVIGADAEVQNRYSVAAPRERSMVAMPFDMLELGERSVASPLASGTLRAELLPESSVLLGELSLELSSEALSSALLELCWGAGERNHYLVLGAEKGWFPGPGAFLVAPGQERRFS
jgi:beta-mannosidase